MRALLRELPKPASKSMAKLLVPAEMTADSVGRVEIPAEAVLCRKCLNLRIFFG